MTPLEQMILAVLCSSGLTGAVMELIKYFVSRHDRKSGKEEQMKCDIQELTTILESLVKDVEDLKEGQIVMMHDRIHQAFTYMKDLPSITTTDRANVDYLAERYFHRGGNHKAKLMYGLICKKPVVYDNEEETDENNV